MLWHRTSKTIIEQWEADAAYSLEAGEKPVFSLGSSDISLDGLLGLSAVQKMFENRDSIVQPLIAMGGHSMLWLFALLQTTRNRAQIQTAENSPYGLQIYNHTKSPDVIFTGVDPTTQIAALATQTSTGKINDATAISPKERWTGLNTAMRHQFAPTSEPGAIAQAASLPFTSEPVRNQHALTRYTHSKSVTHQSVDAKSRSATTVVDSSTADEETRWTASAMIGLALLMLIAAVFL